MDTDKMILDELNKVGILGKFSKVLIYDGDKELNSSCNDEYTLDADDCVITNGITNHCMQRVNSGSEVVYTTSVRGATFVIILSYDEIRKPILDLRMDRPRYINTIGEIQRILDRLDRMDGYTLMNHYLNYWRSDKQFILQNHQFI